MDTACSNTLSVQTELSFCFAGDWRCHLTVNVGFLLLSFVARISFRNSSYRHRNFLWLFFCLSNKIDWLTHFNRSLNSLRLITHHLCIILRHLAFVAEETPLIFGTIEPVKYQTREIVHFNIISCSDTAHCVGCV
jgi:hypothetical protein